MRVFRVSVVWAVLSLGVIVSPGVVALSDAEPRREVRIGVVEVPGTLDPATATGATAALVVRQVFDTLVAYRELSTDVEPALATRWSVSRDGLVWNFSLRENVKFHDGASLTAGDVVATLGRHLRSADGHPPSGAIWGPLLRGVPGVVKEVRAPNARTVEIELFQPYAPLLTVLAHPGLGIVRLTGGDGPSWIVGTGPYRVIEAGSGRVALEAVAGHWSGTPKTQRLVFLDVGNDGDGETQLDAKALDVWFASGTPSRTDGALSVTGLRVGYLAFQTERQPFSRKPVRRAVAAALEPTTIARATERWAVPLQSFMPPGVWARREGSPIIGGTREAVKKLLTEGGWPKGTKPTMLVPVAAGTPGMPKLAETIQETLAAADIPITIRTEPEDRARAVLQSGDYGLTLTETTVLGGDPHLFLFPLSTTESASKGPRALNFSYYRNQHLDDVLIRASQLAFRPQRERLYQRAQTMLAADLPWIPLYVRTLWAGVRPEVRGLRLHPTGFHRLTTITVEGP